MMSTSIGESRLPIQMWISSRNTLTDTPRNYALPALWVSFSPVKLTHKINHHSWLPLNTSIRFRCWWTSKKDEAGSSLAAQGLGIHTSIAGAQIRSLVGELRSHMPYGMTKKIEKKILYSFVQAAITKVHRLNGLSNRNRFSHSCRGWSQGVGIFVFF